MNKIVLLGAGGHASVLLDILYRKHIQVSLIVASDVPAPRTIFNNISVISDDDFIHHYQPTDVSLVNGIGMLPHSTARMRIYNHYTALGYTFQSVISPQAIISPFAKLSAGVQILPGAIVQAGSSIDENSIINSRAVIEHDDNIGQHNHIAPAAVLCGGVNTQENVYIGAGAVVIQNIKVGANSIIGAGAVIKKNIAPQSTIYS